MKGSDRNKKCSCGSGKKWKKCCGDDNKKLDSYSEKKGQNKSVPEEVLEYFGKLKRDNEFLKSIGIFQNDQQSITRIDDGYLIPLGNRIFKIKSDEALSFYDVIGVIALETLGNEWIESERKKKFEDRSELYKILSLLGATDTFKKVIAYEGSKIKSSPIPESGFSKSFLTLAYDIFCLRRSKALPSELVERLKNFDQFQGARYEIAVAAIFCRLGYTIKWLDNKKAYIKHPEFIAEKDGKKIYVEAKSRHISGVHNKQGKFDQVKAFKSAGWGALINKAVDKKVPKGEIYLVFIDINAINDGWGLPNWVTDVKTTLEKQHLKNFENKNAPFTSIIFTNYAYHYQGMSYAENGESFLYENEKTERLFNDAQEKRDILNAVKHYGFIPDYYIPGKMSVIQNQSEYPRINNISDFLY